MNTRVTSVSFRTTMYININRRKKVTILCDFLIYFQSWSISLALKVLVVGRANKDLEIFNEYLKHNEFVYDDFNELRSMQNENSMFDAFKEVRATLSTHKWLAIWNSYTRFKAQVVILFFDEYIHRCFDEDIEVEDVEEEQITVSQDFRKFGRILVTEYLSCTDSKMIKLLVKTFETIFFS
jgi:hypothetical protein